MNQQIIRGFKRVRNLLLILMPLHCLFGAGYKFEYDRDQDCFFRTARIPDDSIPPDLPCLSSQQPQQLTVFELGAIPTPCRSPTEASETVPMLTVEISGQKEEVRVDEFIFKVFMDGEFKDVRVEFDGNRIRLYLDKERLPFVHISHRAIPNKEEKEKERRFISGGIIFSIWRMGLNVSLVFANFTDKRILQNNLNPLYLTVINPYNGRVANYNQNDVFSKALRRYALSQEVFEGLSLKRNTYHGRDERDPFALRFYVEDGILMVYQRK